MRMVLVGAGMVGEVWLRAFAGAAAQGVTLHGIHARKAESRETFPNRAEAALGRRPAVYASLAAIASDPEVDAVALITPPDARAEAVALFAEAGKPILAEKPLERDSAAAERLVMLCEIAGVPFGVMLQHRARAASQEARRLLGSGVLGEIGLVTIDVPWWRGQEYYDAPGRGAWARDGGGVMITQAIHAIDLALWLAGPARAVQGIARTSRFHRMESEDFVAAGLDFSSGAVGALTATTAAFPGAPETVTIHADAAVLTLHAGKLAIRWRDGREEALGADAATGSGADPMAFAHDWHQIVLEDFAAAVAGNRPPLAPARSALRAHRLIDALALSSREGRRVILEEA